VSDVEHASAWRSASAIAAKWVGVTAPRVYRAILLLGLRGSADHRRVVGGRAEYSPAAVALIERELAASGYRLALALVH
jgi:hypothetical protein